MAEKGDARPLPRGLSRLERLLTRGLAATAALWPPIELAYGWVHQAAHLLHNDAAKGALAVRAASARLLGAMGARRDDVGPLAPALDHFLKVTDSYAPGRFHCYAVDGLPPTDNDLEHVFGSARHHERRTTGRKVASAALVVRGAVRVVAAVATQQRQQRDRPFGEADLRLQRPADLARWRHLRAELTHRQAARCAQRRFRRDPDAYLTALEAQLLQPGLPA
jgi:hypothetical protein